MTPAIPPPVNAVFKAVPKAPRARLLHLRDIIFAAATSTESAPLEETLKWGQPSYLPRAKRTGTTLRLGWNAANPDRVSLFVPCQTTLIDTYRDRFSDAATYDGNRGIHLEGGAKLDDDALHQIAALALTYHRATRKTRTETPTT